MNTNGITKSCMKEPNVKISSKNFTVEKLTTLIKEDNKKVNSIIIHKNIFY